MLDSLNSLSLIQHRRDPLLNPTLQVVLRV